MKAHIVSLLTALFVASNISQAAINPNLISTLTELTEDGETGTEYANFLIHFNVEAENEDVYIPFVSIYTNLFYAPGVPTYEITNTWLYSTADEVVGDYGQLYYEVLEGNQELFTYVATFRSDVDTLVTFKIEDVVWNNVPSTESSSSEIWNGEMHSVGWEADPMYITGSTPEPSTALLAFTGCVGLMSFRRRN